MELYFNNWIFEDTSTISSPINNIQNTQNNTTAKDSSIVNAIKKVFNPKNGKISDQKQFDALCTMDYTEYMKKYGKSANSITKDKINSLKNSSDNISQKVEEIKKNASNVSMSKFDNHEDSESNFDFK